MEKLADIIVLSGVMILPLFGVVVASSILWNYLKYLTKK